jgi:superfamily I DNA/RNA helicase
MSRNRLIIASAGSGKTTFLVDRALSIETGNVLITTFTESNREEIIKKILEKKRYVPQNIVVQTWFSFLLEHGVRPYQDSIHQSLHSKRIGFYLNNGQSAQRISENDTYRHFFTKDLKVYSDKISKFSFRCDEKTQGEVVRRISRIYSHILIDEVQDMAGWDLEFIKLLLMSNSQLMLVGDPRQAVYDTNDSPKNAGFRGVNIVSFFAKNCRGICTVDTSTLKVSHRNNSLICDFSSALYPCFEKSISCNCEICKRDASKHQGIFLIKRSDVPKYRVLYFPQELFPMKAIYPGINFGVSKGLTFPHVLLHPTKPILKYLQDGKLQKTIKKKGKYIDVNAFDIAKFYVAVTRARYSVAIICDYGSENYLKGVTKI